MTRTPFKSKYGCRFGAAKKYILAAIVCIVFFGTANAQLRYKKYKHYFTVAWSGSLPTTGFRENYISAASINGASIQGQFFVMDNIGIAATFGWNTYYQQLDNAQYELPGQVISSNQRRYLHAMPLRASVNYFFIKNTRWQFYGGLGFGGVYMTQHAEIQHIDFWGSQWGFQITPEAGIYYRFADRFALHASALYNVSTNSFNFGDAAINNMQSATLNIGITLMF